MNTRTGLALGESMALFTPRSPDMNTRTGLAPRTLPVHLMVKFMLIADTCTDNPKCYR